MKNMKDRRSLLAAAVIGVGIVASLMLTLAPRPTLGKSDANKLVSISADKTDSRKIKMLHGEALRNRIEGLRNKNKGLARAMKEFEKRGRVARMNDSLVVQLTAPTTAANLKGGFLRPASYVQDISDGDSEIDFITYSGDYDSWTGIVNVITPYSNDTYSGTFLTPTDDGSGWDVTGEVYYPPDGGDPQCGSSGHECLLGKTTPSAKPAGSKGRVSAAHHRSRNLRPATTSPGNPRPGFFGWLRNWWHCVNYNCAWGSALYCSGSFRVFCSIGICTYSVFYCL